MALRGTERDCIFWELQGGEVGHTQQVLVHRGDKMLLDGMGSTVEADMGELAFGGCLPVRKTQYIFKVLPCARHRRE